MSRTMLADVDGFTPIIDDLARDIGLMTAIVFGLVWRRCQMSAGYCWAAQDKIGDVLGISRKAVNEHVKKLIECGYLRVDGHTSNGTVKLFDTGKAGIKLSMSASVTQSDTGCNPKLQPDVTESYTKIVVKKEKETTLSNFDKTETREPCDIDGVPDSWKEEPSTHPIKDQVTRLVSVFENVAKIARPVRRYPRDFAKFAKLWVQPLENMLAQEHDDVDSAAQIIEEAVEQLTLKKFTINSPQSIEKTFIGLSSAKQRRPKLRYKDPDGNWVERDA